MHPCVYAHMRVHMYVRMCTCIAIMHACMYVCVMHVYMVVCMHAFKYVWNLMCVLVGVQCNVCNVCMCVRMYVSMLVCMHAFMYVC